jgi:hypothetical protein
MTNRERMMACLRRENEAVPYWPMGFFNRATAERLMGDGLYDSYYFHPTTGAYGFAPLAESERERLLAFNQALGKCAVGLGRGGFILMEASGIPDTVSPDTWRQFRALISPLRG